MKIAVFSDTHGLVGPVIKLARAKAPFQAIIHAGDHYRDAGKIAAELKVPCYAVVGNCDELDNGPRELVVTLAGCKIFITHGHLFRVKAKLDTLFYRARELEADVAVFGHSHIPINVRENNLLLFNPGSPTRPASGFKASFGVLTIADGVAQGEIISF